MEASHSVYTTGYEDGFDTRKSYASGYQDSCHKGIAAYQADAIVSKDDDKLQGYNNNRSMNDSYKFNWLLCIPTSNIPWLQIIVLPNDSSKQSYRLLVPPLSVCVWGGVVRIIIYIL